METQTAKPSKTILNYGLLLGIISVFIGVISYVTNTHLSPHWSVMIIGFLIFAGIIIYGIKAFRKDNGGFLSLGEALKVGVGIALIAGIIGVIWFLLLANVIEPTFSDQMADMQREQMTEMYPNMGDEQIEQAMEFNSRFTTPWVLAGISLVRDMFLGFIVALVAGLIMKQKRPYEV